MSNRVQIAILTSLVLAAGAALIAVQFDIGPRGADRPPEDQSPAQAATVESPSPTPSASVSPTTEATTEPTSDPAPDPTVEASPSPNAEPPPEATPRRAAPTPTATTAPDPDDVEPPADDPPAAVRSAAIAALAGWIAVDEQRLDFSASEPHSWPMGCILAPRDPALVPCYGVPIEGWMLEIELDGVITYRIAASNDGATLAWHGSSAATIFVTDVDPIRVQRLDYQAGSTYGPEFELHFVPGSVINHWSVTRWSTEGSDPLSTVGGMMHVNLAPAPNGIGEIVVTADSVPPPYLPYPLFSRCTEAEDPADVICPP